MFVMSITCARSAVGREFVAGIADALEGAVHVDALAVGAHARLTALVHVDAERADGRVREAVLAHALVRSGHVLAAAVQTDARILRTLVHVCTINKRAGESNDDHLRNLFQSLYINQYVPMQE